jgi:hypothetical protein
LGAGGAGAGLKLFDASSSDYGIGEQADIPLSLNYCPSYNLSPVVAICVVILWLVVHCPNVVSAGLHLPQLAMRSMGPTVMLDTCNCITWVDHSTYIASADGKHVHFCCEEREKMQHPKGADWLPNLSVCKIRFTSDELHLWKL